MHVYRQLGAGGGLVPGGVNFWALDPRQRAVRAEAIWMLAAGLSSASSLVLFAMGRNREAYMVGVGSALTTAIFGAIRLFAQEGTS